MRERDELLFDLKLVDKLIGVTFGKTNLDFYFAGGSACVLAGYIDRATRDFDFVDRGYSSQFSKVLKLLEPYDLLTNYFAAIPKNYADRATKLDEFENMNVYLFSKEDIIASKIDRLSEKDIDDIGKLIINIDKHQLFKSIEETICNIVYDDKKEKYIKKLEEFMTIFDFKEGI